MKPAGKVDGIELGEAIIKAYATDANVTTDECEEIGLTEGECSAVAGAVDGGSVNESEGKFLLDKGFSKEFIDTISGKGGQRLSKTLSLFQDISLHLNSYPPLSSSAIASLVTYLKHKDPVVREWAAEAISCLFFEVMSEMDAQEYFGDHNDFDAFSTAVPGLIDALKDADPDVRTVAADALWELAQYLPEAKDALTPLLKMIGNDPDPDARGAAVFALDSIVYMIVYNDPSKAEKKMINEEVVPVLIDALEDDDAYVRAEAVSVLGITNVKSDEVFGALVSALGDADDGPRGNAASALHDFGPKAVPVLVDALGDEKPLVVMTAISSLKIIGSPKALPALKALLKHEDELVKGCAQEAIKELKGNKKKKGK